VRIGFFWAGLCAASALCTGAHSQTVTPMTPHTLVYAPGKSITLSLPAPFTIDVAATGLKRVRFFAEAPDGRIFATGMYDLSDNTRGSVFILDGWNEKTHRFTKITHYLDHLRNPNNLAFWTDPKTGQAWLYLPMTDKMVRYRYKAGDNAPSLPPETLIRFPDYGLHYKYGGWHLTRTVAIAEAADRTHVFVSVGSSCNYCREREVLRAAVVAMDPDGSNQRLIAQGLRNAVDLRYLSNLDGGTLMATNMGDDHLGPKLPEDTFFAITTTGELPRNYGWPTCYFAHGRAVHDATPLPDLKDAGLLTNGPEKTEESDSVYGNQKDVAAAGTNLAAGGGHADAPDPNGALGEPPTPLGSCQRVPMAYTTFAAHSSPLGFQFFPPSDARLGGSFLVALHGASHPSIGTGYRVTRFTPRDRGPKPFITGFLTWVNGKPVVHGRPCGIFRVGPDSFLLSDDYLGLIYFVHPSDSPASGR
jgi:glucose/arabinose dehydrogenase